MVFSSLPFSWRQQLNKKYSFLPTSQSKHRPWRDFRCKSRCLYIGWKTRSHPPEMILSPISQYANYDYKHLTHPFRLDCASFAFILLYNNKVPFSFPLSFFFFHIFPFFSFLPIHIFPPKLSANIRPPPRPFFRLAQVPVPYNFTHMSG
jgi:hypothetical protein